MPDPVCWDAPQQLVHDVARCLALISMRSLECDPGGQLTRAGRALLLRHTSSWLPRGLAGGRLPRQVPIFALLGRAGFAAAAGRCLCLSPGAHDWLALPKPRQFVALRDVWLREMDLSWSWLGPTRRRRSLDSRWQTLILSALEELLAIPPGTPTSGPGLLERLEARGRLVSPHPGRNLSPARLSAERQGRELVWFLLEQILPSLGLVEPDTAGVEPLYRVTQAGAAWLRSATGALLLREQLSEEIEPADSPAAPAPRFPADGELSLTPSPDTSGGQGVAFELAIPLSAQAVASFEVAHLADLVSLGPPARYRLTRQSLERAQEWGYSVSDAQFLLSRLCAQPLPAEAVATLHGWHESMAVVKCEPGYCLRFAGPGVLAGLRKRRPFQQRTLPLASRTDAWVPVARAHELFRYLRRVGYQVKEEGILSFRKTEVGARPRGIPLPSLLVTLRTYQRLRHLVPGLAALDELDGVDGEIAAALGADDLAAVEGLVESHAVFLRHHLKRDRAEAVEEGAAEGAVEARPEGRAAPELEAPGAGARAPGIPGREELQATLQAAISAGRRLELTYTDTQGQQTTRTVRPLHLETRWGRLYLLAFCELRRDERHFRLDRIVEARPA